MVRKYAWRHVVPTLRSRAAQRPEEAGRPQFSLVAPVFAAWSLSVFFLAGASPDAAAKPDRTPGPEDDAIEIIFDKIPVERGLTFDRDGMRATTVELGGKTEPAWVAERSVEPAAQWIHSVRFKVNDERFRNGARPVVDIEIIYHLPGAASASVLADTQSGGRQIRSGRGNTKDWRTLLIRLDDAFFGSRDHQSDKPAPVDGFDLRVNSASPLYIRKIRIVGYDPKKNVRWDRMLQVSQIRCNNPGGVLAFPRGKDQALTFDVQNVAQVSCPLRYTIEISDRAGTVRHRAAGTATIPGSAIKPLPTSFDTSDWPLGPYEGRLSLFAEEKAEEPAYVRDFQLGVISDTRLAKAREGEFLYGLDCGFRTYFSGEEGAEELAYFRLMGVDILRTLNPRFEPNTIEATEKALTELAAQDLQAGLMIPPFKDPERARKDEPATLAFLEEAARRFAGHGPGKIRYWEMGNEPDLPGFFDGPMEEYTQLYEAMYDAVKRGAGKAGLAPDDTVVMNGGLSLSGQTGQRRSREFLKLVNPEKLDAIAYHGHGPGIESERACFERVEAMAAEEGKAGRPFIETETGFSATTPNGEIEQARTVVEKMLYAQSLGMPTMYYFRLFMWNERKIEAGYGMTSNNVEPRPSVLSYRNMVERLRHHAFQRIVDCPGAAGVNAFLFEQRDENSQPTGRKTLAVFSEETMPSDLTFSLDGPQNAVRDAEVFDLFGNRSPASLLPGNVAALRAGIDPVYLTWTSPGPAAGVEAIASPLGIEEIEPLITGNATPLKVVVRNRSQQAIRADLNVEAHARAPITVTPERETLEIPAGGTATVPLQVTLDRATVPLAMPRRWKVFLDVDFGKLTPEILATLPDTLPGTKGAVQGRVLSDTDGKLDFGKLAGGSAEKRPAVAFATLDSPVAVELPAAASADWWMAWYVNGKKIYDTLKEGNQHGTLADHKFTLPLKAGKNTLAVGVLSGSYGWKVEIGGPKERGLAETAGTDPDRLVLSLRSGGEGVEARKIVPLPIRSALAPLKEPGSLDDLKTWLALDPVAELDDSAVTNEWDKEPDQSRWYKGTDDLSALAWLRPQGGKLHLAVAVRDDKMAPPASGDEIGTRDGLRVVLADETGKVISDTSAGLVAGQAVLAGDTKDAAATIIRNENTAEGPVTFYHLTLPKSLVGTKPFRLNLAVSDADENFPKQTLSLGDPAQPHKGIRLAVE